MVEKPKDIKVILAEAMEKSTAAERSAYLDGICRGDADLRAVMGWLEALEGESKERSDFGKLVRKTRNLFRLNRP